MNSNENTPNITDFQAEYFQLQEKNKLLNQEIERLRYYIEELKRVIYGSQKERFISSGQASLFADSDPIPESATLQTETICFERRKPKKKFPPHHIIPDHLPRIRQEYLLSESERQCPCGCGILLKKIGEEISERIEINPAQIYVKQYVRAC